MKIPTTIVLLFFLTGKISACTLFWACAEGQNYCAKNMDWSNPATRMHFIPASDDKYGRVYFGVETSYGFTNTSGMNEVGLWYGGASLQSRDDVWNTHNKPEWDGELIEKIMEECSTVEEAIGIFSLFWEPHWNGHTLIADKYGNSVVVEYGNDDVIFIRNQETYQVITNFYLSDTTNERWYNCPRYRMARYMLEDAPEPSFSLFRRIANATHAEGRFQTRLTTILHLNTGNIRIHHGHNFDEVLKINLHEQLKMGEQYLSCPDFFSGLKLCSPVYCKDGIALSWWGDNSSYFLQYSLFEDFREYQELSTTKKEGETGLAWLLFIMIAYSQFNNKNTQRKITGFSFIKKPISNHNLYPLIIPLLLFSLSVLPSCEYPYNNPNSSDRYHEIKLLNTDLNPDTTYYWRVVNDHSPDCGSVPGEFRTH